MSSRCSYEIDSSCEIRRSKVINNNNDGLISALNIPNYKIKDIVLDFIIVLSSNFPNEYLINFYNNIGETTIERKLLPFNRENGYYELDNQFGKNKRIVVSKYPYLYHELFHLASSSFSDETLFDGFSQEYRKGDVSYTIGDALNEGYTELLTRRYFPDKYIASAYNYQVGVVEKLEKIIGKQKMQEMYFKADLYGLVEELSKYTSKGVVRNFILFNDFLLLQDQAKMSKEKKKEAVKEAIGEINDFLAGVFLVKQQIRKDNQEIDEEEFINNLKEYVELFKMKNEDGSFSYPNNSETINELLEALEIKPSSKVYSKSLRESIM